MSKKILIVDDDRSLTHLLNAYLSDKGYKIVIAHDGEGALLLLESERPDLIVLDIVMPKMNGYDFLFEMRKMDEVSKTPVIVLTGKADMAEIFKVEGVLEYLIKPFAPQDLMEKIRKYI